MVRRKGLMLGFALLAAFALHLTPAMADDLVKVAIGQRGNWNSAIPHLGEKAGIFKKHGIALELLYTSGGGETQQAVISGSADIGVSPGTLGVLGAFATTPVLHWHGDNFELPANAVRLASTTACPNQAFALGNNLLGLQFHIEADPARIEQWLVGHTVELGKAGIDPRELRRQAATLGRATAEKGKAALTAWLDGVGKR